MVTIQKFKLFIVIAALLFAGLACDISASDTPTPTAAPSLAPTAALKPTSEPTSKSAVTPSKPAAGPTAGSASPTPAQIPTSLPPSGDNLNSTQKQQLARATVRIEMMKKTGGKLVAFGTGSGTLLTKDGTILTNCHVADPGAMGESAENIPDALVIDVVVTEDHPPVSTYLAKLMASDPVLDLAVIQIDKKLDGSAIAAGSLNLPFVKLGNSDEVRFGDPLYVFGFPGIGGQTITFTTGSVSGFDSMDPIGDRAWIKTDATIAGGNSGGLASNSRAEIIGVPTRIGTSSASRLTDCRFIADTNGDGKIDEKDTCVPTGGFINAVRPVNWAKPLIEAGLNKTAYTSPYKSKQPAPTKSAPPQAASGKFTLAGWATALDANNCPAPAVQSFASGVKKIFSVFKFNGMPKGTAWAYRWTVDDHEVFSKQDTWQNPDSGQCFNFSLDNNGKALPDGSYKLEIYSGAKFDLAGTAVTKVGGAAVPSKGVQVTGKTVDANTGKGIGGIYIILLKPGIDPDTWLNNNGLDSDIASHAQSSDSGDFVLPDLLERGKSYGAVVGNKKLGYQTLTGFVDVAKDDPDVIKLKLELTK